MTRYRASYVRAGAVRHVTFASADLVETAEFVELWQKVTGCSIIELKPDVQREAHSSVEAPCPSSV